jgi:hypothetical protein
VVTEGRVPHDSLAERAAALPALGIRCLYDADEQADLWGEHLSDELSAICQRRSTVAASAVSPTWRQ